MIVDTQFLAGVRTTFKAVFDQVQTAALASDAIGAWQKFVTVIPSEGKKTVTFNWLGTPPMLRTIKGTIDFGKAFAHNYTINVTENGVGIEIGEADFMSDPLSSITLFVKSLFSQAAKYDMKISAEALSDGFTLLGFDGVSFYNAAHSYGDSATHDNLDTAVLTNLGTGPFMTAYIAINTAEGDDGEPLSLVPDTLIVHPTNLGIARQLLNATMIANTSNVFTGMANLVVTPFLKTTTEWHLVVTELPIRPIIHVEQMPARFVAQDGLDSDSAFTQNVFRYKVDNKKSVGHGDPRSAYGSDGTV